ncbi:hypothetical protein STCU_04204 [Strigomonas culicis]|uniref:MATH domain-containing protein n=1 Tax=Strigomonas culicis TaxID=28005 RepID=S9UML4_9TRYP|nr:hypothetical protein STCU_09029 [Strigomonas culicis]EPY30163.1 hypothetical protein STCU_04204 [Strigomonas culicis]|eukprot:EPY20364.1 hypothetical protein STCU_09029 [Strigomonas culicis]
MEIVEALEVFSATSARYRYRVPVSEIRELQYNGFRYSPEFEVGGWMWRFHIQERKSDGDRFLALHLQNCSQGSVPVHFRLTVVCMRDPLLSKSKTFHCTFKKAGSAWGLHQFIPMSKLLHPDSGFVYTVEETGTRCVDFEVMLQVEDGVEGSAPLTRELVRSVTSSVQGGNSGHYRSSPSRAGGSLSVGRRPSPQQGALVRTENSVDRRSLGRGANAYGGPMALRSAYGDPEDNRMLLPGDGLGAGRGSQGHALVATASPAPVRAALAYPFEHLESLCDMSFDVQGVRIKAHRCIVGCRMRPLLPDTMVPLQPGCIVSIAVPLDVFTAFLRYVYTEDFPDAGVLPVESLLDLYLISTACEFYDLSALCLKFVKPLLAPENILPIVLTRYNAADEVLTALYLRVLLEYYDILIQDKQFEEIPGHLFRRLSLILARRETVPNAPIPAMKNSLGKQLVWLAETGEYSDMEWTVGPQQYTIRAHRYILACRSALFSQAMNPHSQTPLPVFTTGEFDFTVRSWHKLLCGLYRRHFDTNRDFSAEDIAIVFKMHNTLGLDGLLKREAEEALNGTNALRLFIYSIKHSVTELQERAMAHVASNFQSMTRNDPQVWDLISELPQAALVSLFRTVTEHQN